MSRRKADYFIFSKDTNGDQFYQLHRFDLATGDVTSLTEAIQKRIAPLVALR